MVHLLRQDHVLGPLDLDDCAEVYEFHFRDALVLVVNLYENVFRPYITMKEAHVGHLVQEVACVLNYDGNMLEAISFANHVVEEAVLDAVSFLLPFFGVEFDFPQRLKETEIVLFVRVRLIEMPDVFSGALLPD